MFTYEHLLEKWAKSLQGIYEFFGPVDRCSIFFHHSDFWQEAEGSRAWKINHDTPWKWNILPRTLGEFAQRFWGPLKFPTSYHPCCAAIKSRPHGSNETASLALVAFSVLSWIKGPVLSQYALLPEVPFVSCINRLPIFPSLLRTRPLASKRMHSPNAQHASADHLYDHSFPYNSRHMFYLISGLVGKTYY